MADIKLKKSSVVGKSPLSGDLQYGEVAINFADGRLYYKNSSDVIKNFIDSDLIVTRITDLVDSSYVQARQSATGGTDFIFKTISVSGQSDVVADTTTDTLTLAAGTGMSITTDAGTDTITFTSTGSGLDSAAVDAYLRSGDVDLLNFTDSSAWINWNSVDGTLDLHYGSDVTLQIGQEQHYYAKATESISNGDVVMFAGAQGDHILISKADVTATGFIDEWVVGVATQDFNTNDFGYVTSFGKVRGLDTDTPGWSEGDLLYLDPSTPGGLTSTKPTSPDHSILIAAVLSVNPAQGVILVRPTFGFHLGGLHDVYIDSATLSHNQFIMWDSAQKRWENITPTTTYVNEGTNLYYTTARVDSDIDARVTKSFVDALNVDADTFDTLNSTQFLRSDAADTKTSGDLSFSDNVKAIFGDGNDLEIYHDGTNSRIVDTGTGELRLQGTNLRLWSAGGENYLTAVENGAVSLYYDDSAKIATTNTGVDVTGDVNATGNLILPNHTLRSGTSTTTATTQVALETISATTYSAAEVLITAVQGTIRHITKLLVTHDGTTAIATEYGTVQTGASLATYDVDINSGNIRVLATPASATSTKFNTMVIRVEN